MLSSLCNSVREIAEAFHSLHYCLQKNPCSHSKSSLQSSYSVFNMVSSWVSSRQAAYCLAMSMLLGAPVGTAAFSTSPVISTRPDVHFRHAIGNNRPALLPGTAIKKYPMRPLAALTFSSKQKSNDDTIRPDWACDWMPTWLISMRPSVQFMVGLAMYVFHLKVLTQGMIAFPCQIIPNDRGFFQSIGLDS